MLEKITKITAREILSSGSSPTVEATVYFSDNTTGSAAVPYGASAGIHEATVLLDSDNKRYNGKGMQKAVTNIVGTINKTLVGQNPFKQRKIDELMIAEDGTDNKSKLGGNAILSVSLANIIAAAKDKGLPLYQYIRKSYNLSYDSFDLPKPMMVVIEGGKHAENSTDFQEYLICPIGAANIKEAVRYGVEVYQALKTVLSENNLNANVGNEGAYAPPGITSNEVPFQLIMKAIEKAGYKPGKDIAIAIDPAASEFYEDGKYNLAIEDKKLTAEEMITYYKNIANKYPLISLEDGLAEDDWDNWPKLKKALGDKIVIMGDDLTVTNQKRLQMAIDKNAINSILIKLNQIGTVSETIDTIKLSQSQGYTHIVSHRGGGEVNDAYLVDLAVATNASYIKVGPSRGERVSKYNRLMAIEDEVLNQ